MFDVTRFPNVQNEELNLARVAIKCTGPHARRPAVGTSDESNALDFAMSETHLVLSNPRKMTISSRLNSPENAREHLSY